MCLCFSETLYWPGRHQPGGENLLSAAPWNESQCPLEPLPFFPSECNTSPHWYFFFWAFELLVMILLSEMSAFLSCTFFLCTVAFLAVLSSYLFPPRVSQGYTAAPYCSWALSPWNSWTSLRGLEEEKGDESDGNTVFLENMADL